MLNERFSGLKIKEIAENITSVLSDVEIDDQSGIIRVFMDSAEDIFEDVQVRRFYFGGAEYMAMQPEFSDLKNYRSIVELIENEDLIIHLFDEHANQETVSDVKIRIGSENKIQQIASCSVVSADYNLGSAKGTIGLVGPTRMNYPKMVALVEQLAGRLNQKN
jgi:heat-inducible transcriptional repressor